MVVSLYERSLDGNDIFARMQLRNGYMDNINYNIYSKLLNLLKKTSDVGKVSKVIYLRCPPTETQNRIRIRNRPSELNGCPLNYLTQLHILLEETFNNDECVVIDASKPADVVFSEVAEILEPLSRGGEVIHVAIEGNIGVGKTTLIRLLSKTIPECKLQYEEPVADWPLEQYYKDHAKWAFPLQIATLLSVAENKT